MPGHSRSKNGVASLAYVPGIHVLMHQSNKDVDGRDKPGHDGISGGLDPPAGRHILPPRPQ
jgi:hypothetical protein